MDPRVNPNAYGGYVYQSSDPRTDAPTSWGMYSPTLAHSTIPVAQGKEQLHSATSALMSLQSEPSHTVDQYAPIRSGERPGTGRTQSERQSREEWTAPPGQATSSALGFDSQSHPNTPFGNSGTYLQGAHRWASGSSTPSTPTARANSSQPVSYLSASGPPTTNYPPLVTHAPQPLHAQSATTGSQFLASHSAAFPSALSPSTITRPQPDTGLSTSSLPLNPRRRSSTSTSTSSSNTIAASALGLHLADPAKAHHSSENLNVKLARSRSTLNLTSEGGSGSAPREKPKLLTKDQKKRNHIFSEQKVCGLSFGHRSRY